MPFRHSINIVRRPPRLVSAHRISCFALYRSLLRQCPRVPVQSELLDSLGHKPLRHIVWKRFKKNASLDSPELIVGALKIGYNALEILKQASGGNEAASLHVHNILQQLSRKRAIDAELKATSPRPRNFVKPRVAPYPGAPKLLDVRPLPKEKLSGKRQVPVLAGKMSVPFLRFKKPQSPYMTRVINDRIKWSIKHYDRVKDMEYLEQLAETEEQWEKLVRASLPQEGNAELRTELDMAHEGEKSWTSTATHARQVVMDSLRRDEEKSKVLGRKMTTIVEQERELWEKERQERWRSKKLAKKARRQGLLRRAEDVDIKMSALVEPTKGNTI